MRLPKISLRKYFYFTLICALLLVFGFNIRDRELWKSKSRSAQRSQDVYTNALRDDIDTENDEDESNSAEKSMQTHKVTPNSLQQNSDKHFSITDATPTDSEQQKQEASSNEPTAKPWFFKNGEYYPTPVPTRKKLKAKKDKSQHRTHPRLFPHQDPFNDRIINQLMYVPANYERIKKSGKLKKILLYDGLSVWNVKPGREVFRRLKCPVDTCEVTSSRDKTADLIVYKDYYKPSGYRKQPHQVTLLYYLECPYHTQNVLVKDAINWTATYRRDSDIVAPYEKWQYYNPDVRQMEQDRNYSVNKTKKVAWFVSNCAARNGRLQYAHELQKHIEVDIYGSCGNYKCSRSNADKCFDMLDHEYKFYLAFENSNCKDYITEKFFVNALSRNILPIVMGARPEDYEISAPERSYIHVDEFSSPKELAEYLNILDKDEELYNSYFKWKGTGEFINTFFWCRVCAVLHDEEYQRKPHWYSDINDWWRGAGVCTNGSWRNFKARKDIISDD